MTMREQGQYLLHNIDILAVAAGYSRNAFLKKIKLHPASYIYKIDHDTWLSRGQIQAMDKFIKAQKDPWLSEIYEQAKEMDLERADIFRPSETRLPDRTSRTILYTNMRSLRYFLGLSRRDVAKGAGCCEDTISAIESNRFEVTDDTCDLIYLYLKIQAEKRTRVQKSIFKAATHFELATKIPRFVRC